MPPPISAKDEGSGTADPGTLDSPKAVPNEKVALLTVVEEVMLAFVIRNVDV